MYARRWLRTFIPLCLCLLLVVTACAQAPNKQAVNTYEQIQQETTGRNTPAAVAKEAEKGSAFNQFFPTSNGDYEVVPAQEKKGFAEYKLKRNGETVAMLAINDTLSVPTAAAKYQNASEAIAGHPTVDQGITATGLLVNGRYQVKVLSRSPDFSRDDRVDWLQKFDLIGLAQLEPAPEQSAAPGESMQKASSAQPAPVLQPAT